MKHGKELLMRGSVSNGKNGAKMEKYRKGDRARKIRYVG